MFSLVYILINNYFLLSNFLILYGTFLVAKTAVNVLQYATKDEFLFENSRCLGVCLEPKEEHECYKVRLCQLQCRGGKKVPTDGQNQEKRQPAHNKASNDNAKSLGCFFFS